ncbi:MAG: O-antigen ligase family protein [Paludibacteraceae bacterium]|nr:O-antigen ligase family protein [Paludibacteraceae bacterium]
MMSVEQTLKPPFSWSIFLASVSLAFFVDVKALNYIIRAVTQNLEGGFMSMLYIGISSVILLVSFFLQKHSFKSLFNYVGFLFLILICAYFYTNKNIGPVSVSFNLFAVFTLMAFVTPSLLEYDARIVLKTAMLLPIIGLFFSSRIFVVEFSSVGTVDMAVCYAFLVPIVANFIYCVVYYKQEKGFGKKLTIICTIVNLFYLAQMIKFGSRGPFLCVVSLFLFFWLVKKGEGDGLSFSRWKVIIAFLLIIFLSLFLEETMRVLSSFFHEMGIKLNVIDKFVRKADESGDITNGRVFVTEMAWYHIVKKPFVGHGIDQFPNVTGIVYPHNFLLQLLFDGGILLFSIVIFPVVSKFVKWKKSCSYQEYVLLPFFFFISVPGALVSSNMWKLETLWLFFGLVLSSNFLLKKNG